ncbi:glycine cleavage system protein T, partial [Cellulomonas bogoriensis 69B4 = DSM 16987]
MSPRPTPLADEHRALGATMTGFAGWDMPLRYASDVAEHHAVRRAAGLFDLSHMGQVTVTGPDAGRALDGALVGWVSTLEVGRARYTMLCDADGGVLDDVIVYRTAPEELLVVANAANTDTVVGELHERCAGPGARVEDRTGTTALIAVQGPRALDVLTALVPGAGDRETLSGMRYYAAAGATVRTADGDVQVLAARTGYTGEDGFELFA